VAHDKGHWPYLWREWLTSADHKRIGVMYCVLAPVMLLRGFADAIMMRSQQAIAVGDLQGYLPNEFASSQGATPQRSAFLSAFFTLVGCHGAHVTVGLLWLLVMMAQVAAKGFRANVLRRLACFSLFWHALDIIWVAIFSIVYLIGVHV
jgi:heme/copper-type cytochrome/quinol oxidase subunit 1